MKFNIRDSVKVTTWILANYKGRIIERYHWNDENFYIVYFPELMYQFEMPECALVLIKDAA